MSELSEDKIDEIVETILKNKPINIVEGINEEDFERIQEKLKQKGWR